MQSATAAAIGDPIYEAQARAELEAWRADMVRPANAFDRAAKGLQTRVNAIIPEPVHRAVTAVIERMTRVVLTGADWTTARPLLDATLAEREKRVRGAIDDYKKLAGAEGAVAGAGGFVLAAADFPVLIGLKLKLLFDIVALYGHDTDSFTERLHILSVFQLAFSGAGHRRAVFDTLADWERTHASRPARLEEFDWRRFQQEYRDYIDVAKLAQLIPVIGAPVGFVVNYGLLNRLGRTAIGAHRQRWFEAEAQAAER